MEIGRDIDAGWGLEGTLVLDVDCSYQRCCWRFLLIVPIQMRLLDGDWNNLDVVAGRFGGCCCCWMIRAMSLSLLLDVEEDLTSLEEDSDAVAGRGSDVAGRRFECSCWKRKKIRTLLEDDSDTVARRGCSC